MSTSNESAGETKAGRRRSPGRPSILSRKQVVDGVLSMLDEEHQQDLSIRSIARHLGTGKTTLYNYFDSMDAIRDAVMETLVERLPALDPARAEPLRQQLVQLVMSLYDLSKNHYAIVAQAGMTPGNRAALKLFNSALEALVWAGVDLERAAITLRMLRDFAVASSPIHWGLAGGVRVLTDEDLAIWEPDEASALRALVQSPLLDKPFRESVQSAIEIAIDRMLPELSA